MAMNEIKLEKCGLLVKNQQRHRLFEAKKKKYKNLKKWIGQHFGKGGTFAGKAEDVKEIVYEELKGVKRKALKFKEQDWIDEARDALKTLHNKINAARKQKK